MMALVKDRLEYSRIGYTEPSGSSVHLDHDLEAAISLLRGSIEQSAAVITHEALPVVELPRTQIVRLFQNLIGKALKFRVPGQASVVHVSSERVGDEWIVRIRGNGIGFDPKHAETIFAPFQRLHGHSEYPGSGLGLSACKRIVGSYQGRIGANTKPGEGSTFGSLFR